MCCEQAIRGVTRLDGAQGKKQVWPPMFETEVFRKQMFCVEESTCDIVGTFLCPPQWFCTPIVTWRLENCAPLAPLVTPLHAMIGWYRQVIFTVACCHSVKLWALATRAFRSQHKKYTSLSFAWPIMTRDEHVLGSVSCDFPIYLWIWMLSVLLNQIWIGIGDFLLIFFATFGSLLGLQVAVLIRVFQIHWDCLLCLFKYWALSLTSETSLCHCLSCHQTYRNGLTFIDPIPFLDSSLIYFTYT